MDHSQRSHALLSASGSDRWLNCTPSARLEEAAGKSKSSTYAEEGTLAHKLAELEILKRLGRISPETYEEELGFIGHNDFYSEEMAEEVEKYVIYVIEEFEASKKQTPDAIISIEEKIDLTMFIEEGFGSNDAVIIADGVMKVIDLKYGKGIRVSPEENPQLKLYGLGALYKHELAYNIDVVELTIIQPRLNHGTSWRISDLELKTWGETVVRPMAKKAYAGEGEFFPGDWCKWCAVKAQCVALRNKNMSVAKHDFAEPALLTEEEILEVYKQISSISDWFNAIEEYILNQALSGKRWNGYKLVEGRSNRKWSDEREVSKILTEHKYTADQFMITKLGGIGLIEKLLGKNKFQELLSTKTIKPQGAPVLAPEDDKRPAIGVEQAVRDFT